MNDQELMPDHLNPSHEQIRQAHEINEDKYELPESQRLPIDDLDKNINHETLEKRVQERVAELKKELDDPDLVARKRKEIKEMLEQCAQKPADFIERIQKENPTKTDTGKELISTGTELVPILGPCFTIFKGAFGADPITGEKYHDNLKLRSYQVAEGMVFLALDATGYGVFATKGIKGSRLITRSAALMRRLGLPRSVYQKIYKTGVYISKNPLLVKTVNNSFEQILKKRNESLEQLKTKSVEKFETLSKPIIENTLGLDHDAILIAIKDPKVKGDFEKYYAQHAEKIHQYTDKKKKQVVEEIARMIKSNTSESKDSTDNAN